ncbi:uncharacterized protein BJ212DRAFT_1400043 [Suillus subaureus]|uniref:Uncharacterized protein n=1 Tax=Suillus subaureus TaxID=48587 RepID=A0A9P7DRB1_9AGAM|nr:uncharacterized protein BJ212DRAFT_1400043 [Suillus subaureus]KAG1801049.1 hypothetical protein BJ212DRAFT_1400043 [Suillus subaureus]
MISRFAKSFLAIVLGLFLLATIAFLHPPSRAYIDHGLATYSVNAASNRIYALLFMIAHDLYQLREVSSWSKLGNETAK